MSRAYGAAVAGWMMVMLFGVTGCIGGGPLGQPVLIKRTQMHMGTLVTITSVAADRQTAYDAATAGFQEIHRLEQLLSTWIPTSELSRVNEAAGHASVTVAPETMDVLAASLEIARLTEGRFNIVVGPAVQAWSVLDRQQIPTDSELSVIRPLTDLAALHLDRDRGTVFLARTGMQVDVGGIGKGFAADRAVIAMQRVGATAGVVALSGDMKTFGRLPGGAAFPFAIRHPRREGEVLAYVDLADEAISTAGDYERYFERDGVRYHHILDPSTLQPARDCQSVTVVAHDGTMADGLDTGIFVLGPRKGLEIVDRLPGVGAVIVDREGTVWVSSALRGKVRINEQRE